MILTRVANTIRAEDGPSRPGQTDEFWYQPVGQFFSQAGMMVSPETALRYSAVYACLRFMGNAVGTTPLIMYERLADKGKERATGHPLYEVLRYQPNRYQTAMEFWRLMAICSWLYGNAYARIVPGPRGFVDQLIPIHPTNVEPPKLDKNSGEVTFVVRDPDTGRRTTMLEDEVFWLPGLSAGGVSGLGITEIAKDAIGLALAGEGYGARFFSQGANFGTILEHPGVLTEEGARRLASSFQAAYAGVGNSHKTVILEGGVTAKRDVVSPKDGQAEEQRRFQLEEVARFMGVPQHKIGILTNATFCLPADVEVYAETGPKSIRDVRPGEMVWSRGASGPVLSRVLGSTLSGYQPVLTIRTTNRTLRLTANHRVLARRRVLAPATATIGGIVTPDGWRRLEWATDWVEAGELSEGDTLVALGQLPETGTQYAPTRKVSEGFAEFCGLLLGDGGVRDGYITIARAGSALYMDHYRDVMRREFTKANGSAIHLQENERDTRFSSTLAARELTELGLRGVARTKRVPDWVFRLAPNLRLAVLRGFLDADGSVDKKGRIAFHSVNREMLSQMRHLCMGLGIPVTNLGRGEVNTTLPNGKSFHGEVFRFTCSDPAANRRIGSHDPRYQERFASGQPFGRKGRAYPRYGGAGFTEQGMELSRINSIERGEINEAVYDLAVEGTESFIANGVIVHNSNIEHQAIEAVQDAVMPLTTAIEQRIRMQLIIAKQRFFAEFLLANLLKADRLAEMQAVVLGVNNSLMTPNEGRSVLNLNPLPGGDDLRGPVNIEDIEASGRSRRDREVTEALINPGPMKVIGPDYRDRATALAEEMALTVVNREVKAVTHAAKRTASDRAAFTALVSEFYGEHQRFVGKVMHVSAEAAVEWCERQRRDLENFGVSVMERWPDEKPGELAALALDVEKAVT